ncbi:hypothetical protein Tco_0883209 [Tanacetum coccineum]
MLKVSPWKGVVHFGKRGKLNLRYVGPFKVLKKVGAVVYKLELPQELSRIHNTFHVSNLKKNYSNNPLVVPLEGLQVDDKLYFVEEPVEIMDREVKQLRQSRVPIVKVRWNSRRGPEFTWEREDQFRKKYPHLFTKTAPSSKNHEQMYPRMNPERRCLLLMSCTLQIPNTAPIQLASTRRSWKWFSPLGSRRGPRKEDPEENATAFDWEVNDDDGNAAATLTMPPKRSSRGNPPPPLTQDTINRMIQESVEAAIRAVRERVRNEANRAGGPNVAPVDRECTFSIYEVSPYHLSRKRRAVGFYIRCLGLKRQDGFHCRVNALEGHSSWCSMLPLPFRTIKALTYDGWHSQVATSGMRKP